MKKTRCRSAGFQRLGENANPRKPATVISDRISEVLTKRPKNRPGRESR